MIRRTFLILSAVVAVTLLSASTALAQTTDSQTFTVTVPSIISVAAPADQTLTHDGNDANQSFTPQLWQVSCNSANGASLKVTTRSAFVNGSFKRDAQLSLAKVGGSADNDWNVVGASTVSTDYGGSAEVVSLNASSTKPGSASFNLTVTLVDNSYDDLAAGNYVMTVDGTITAN